MEHINAKKQQLKKQNEYNSNLKKSVSDTASPEEIAKMNARNNFTTPKDLKNEKLNKELNQKLAQSAPLTITDYHNGLNDVNELIKNYSKMDNDYQNDKKQQKN